MGYLSKQTNSRKTYPTFAANGTTDVRMHPLLTGGLFGEHAHGGCRSHSTTLQPTFLSYFYGLSRKHSSSEIGKCQPGQR